MRIVGSDLTVKKRNYDSPRERQFIRGDALPPFPHRLAVAPSIFHVPHVLRIDEGNDLTVSQKKSDGSSLRGQKVHKL